MWRSFVKSNWLPCPGHSDYEISCYGVVRRLTSASNGAPAGKIINPRPGSSPYLMVWLGPKTHRKAYLLHRLVAKAFIGEPPTPQHQAAHKDGNVLNNAWTNLRWATCKENQADKKLHGTHLVGELVGNARLSEPRVREIRSEYANGDSSQRALAKRHGVCQQTISLIVRGKTWADSVMSGSNA